MGVFDDCISEAIEQDRFIDVYRDNQSDETIFGKILSKFDDFLCMSAFNDEGIYAGVRIIKKEHITRLRWGGNKRSSIERVIKDYETPTNLNEIEFGSVASIIQSTNNLFGYIVIYVEDADPDICFIGEILKMDDKYFLMKEYGTMNSMDRTHLVVALNEVTSVGVDGIYERNLVELHKTWVNYERCY